MEIVNHADNGITNFQSLDLISKLNLERRFWLLSQLGKSNWNILPGDSALLEVFKRKLCYPSRIYFSSSFSFFPADSWGNSLQLTCFVGLDRKYDVLTFRYRMTIKVKRLQKLLSSHLSLFTGNQSFLPFSQKSQNYFCCPLRKSFYWHLIFLGFQSHLLRSEKTPSPSHAAI